MYYFFYFPFTSYRSTHPEGITAGEEIIDGFDDGFML
jgi:hypothetical protein